MNSLKKTTLTLILVLSAGFAYSQAYNPAIKVSKGQEYNYQLDMTMDMTQSMGGQEMKFGSTATATIKNSIADVLSNGNIELNVSYWDAKVSSKLMKDTTMIYNGKVGPASKFTVDKYGNVLSKSKADTVQTDSKIPGLDNGMLATVIFCEFPANPIKQGDKWNKERNDSVAAGPMGKLEYKSKSEYTFDSKVITEGKTLYKVTCTSNIQIGGKGNMQGMDFVIEGTGVKNDDIYIDPISGIIFSNKAVMELEMNIAVSGQQNMTIPMTQKMKINVKLIK